MNEPRTVPASPPSRAGDAPDHELCPSYLPDRNRARAFAVVVGTPTQPEVAYLREALPVTGELLAKTGDIEPTEVFRFAGPCARSSCRHYENASGDCRLVRRGVTLLDESTPRIPPCAIRASCKWWRQEGKPACQRCPGIVSSHVLADATSARAATPIHE